MTTPTGILFSDPRPQPLSTTGQLQAGAYYLFYLTGTTTPVNVYADGLLTTPLSQVPGAAQPSCTADSAGRFNNIFLNPATIYRVQLYNSIGVKLEDTDPYVVPAVQLTASGIGTVLYPQTAAEIAAGVTPTFYQYPTSPYDPRRYGAVGDGTTNDTAALQSWINVIGHAGNGEGYLPGTPGSAYLITSPLAVSAQCTIRGGGIARSAIICNNCDAFTIAAGVTQFVVEKVRLNQSVRYQAPNGTVTTNTNAGFRFQGTSGSPNGTVTLRDCFIDGFQTGIVGNFLQFSLIDNCEVVYGLNGIICYGMPVNLNVRGGIYQCGNLSNAGTLAGSIGVQFGDGTSATQGCTITDGCIITGFATNVWLFGANFCKILDSFLDYTNGVSVLCQSNANASTCHDIRDNYMAMTALGTTSIRLLSSTAASNPAGTRISGNTIITYASGCTVGIRVDGTQEQNNVISGNTVSIQGGAALADLLVSADASGSGSSHVIAGNDWQGLGANITVPCTYTGNRGLCITNPNTFVLQPLFSTLQSTLAYSASMTPNLQTSSSFVITATNGSAFTINSPTNPPAQGGNQVRIWISNASGGALGAVSWGGSYKVPAGISYPANTYRRCYEFEQGTAGGLYYLKNSPTVDIPN
jgi:hypothetical protein